MLFVTFSYIIKRNDIGCVTEKILQMISYSWDHWLDLSHSTRCPLVFLFSFIFYFFIFYFFSTVVTHKINWVLTSKYTCPQSKLENRVRLLKHIEIYLVVDSFLKLGITSIKLKVPSSLICVGNFWKSKVTFSCWSLCNSKLPLVWFPGETPCWWKFH